MALGADLLWNSKAQSEWETHIWIGQPVTQPDRYLIPIMGRKVNPYTTQKHGEVTIWRNRPDWQAEVEGRVQTEPYTAEGLTMTQVLETIKWMWLESMQTGTNPF